MFLAAVARPRYDYEHSEGFDGKIGIWPMVRLRKALRTTKHQTRGNPITEPVSVDRTVYASLLNEKVLPAIQAKWPSKNVPFEIYGMAVD